MLKITKQGRDEMNKTIKEIKLGEKDDCYVYATETDGRFYALTEADLEYEKPDAIIWYDSGLYPGVTNITDHMCNKAS
jgi:hypothetical protein